MEKIHIDEVREEATRGKFYVEDDGEIIYIASSEGDVYVCEFRWCKWVRKDNCEANAILLAHEHNTHKMLLDALKMCMVELATSELKTECIKDALFMGHNAIEAAEGVEVSE